MDVREEILTLRRQLEHANFLYYVKDAPEISDFEYDALMRRLEELEAAHPEYASPDSPTQHVGGYALNTFAQVRHQVPLESLQDVFSFDELRAFGARMDGARFSPARGALAAHERLPRRHCVAARNERFALKDADLRNDAGARRRHVCGLPGIGDLRLFHCGAHLHARRASPDVYREPAEPRQLGKRAVV